VVIVGLSGSLNASSRATTLAEHVLAQFTTRCGAQTELIRVMDLAHDLGKALDPRRIPERIELAFERLARADVLVIASPIYKASYTGLLKHFLDLLDPKVLAGKVAVLAANGGSAHHGLVIEHQLRPLAGFFGLWTVPTSIYALDSDFKKSADGTAYELIAPEAISRTALAADQAISLIRNRARALGTK
jgi:FMN reductase